MRLSGLFRGISLLLAFGLWVFLSPVYAGIMASAPVNLFNNIITACEDGIDYESGGSGSCMYNHFSNNRDDGIDLDGSLSNIMEGNLIDGNDNDGIEIRLHPHSGGLCYCRISENPCIDAGTRYLVSGSDTLVHLRDEQFTGTAPDIGALEYTELNSLSQTKHHL